ncbi:hypothetical protein ONZ45_g6635 [Pleurotus djamor]|nr:hypothetical protein ONZ45_g6635 [Pleurotus djamor]
MGTLADPLAPQKAIDEKIVHELKEVAERNDRIRLLRTERNQYSTINKMPDEVCLRIFLCVKLDVEEGPAGRLEAENLMGRKWARPYWFHILWRMLSLAQGPRVDVLLDEPQQLREPFWPSAENVISSRIDQIKTLEARLVELHSPSQDVNSAMGNAAWWMMPALNSLALSGNVPSLPQPSFAPHLTKLHIDINSSVSWSWALDVFQHSPRVEEALIRPLGPEPDDYVGSPTSLPYLRTLSLKLNCSKAFAIFGYLDLPAETSITVSSCFDEIDAPIDLSKTLEAVIARFSSACDPSQVERIAIYFRPFFIYIYRPGDDYNLDESDGEPFIYFSLPISTQVPVSSYLPLCLSLPLAKTKILSLAGVDETSIPMALSIMSTAGPLNTLELCQDVVPLLTLLFAPADAVLPLLPALEYIVLKGSYEGVDNRYDNSDLKNILPVMFRLLRERRKLGIPIQRLQCWDWECVPRSVMKKLRRLVEVVEGD